MSSATKFDVVVVGSGYGGSVVAARLASSSRLLLVERGRRWKQGGFPTSVAGLGRAYMSKRNPLGLWAMRLGDGTGNALASAYGGSSVVNYGITSRPEPHAFVDWPLSEAELEPYYNRALDVLRPEPNPIRDELGDGDFLDWLEPGKRVDIENTIDWDKCTQCGRCVPGCNVGAKRSLDETYLAMAEKAGAEVRTETRVVEIVPRDQGYAVLLQRSDDPSDAHWVETRHLVLAAGTLGTLGLLHDARHRIPVSPLFGQKMGMNGDGLAFLYDMPHRLSSHSGAPISTSVRLSFDDDQGRTRTLMVMSGRVPMAAMRFTGAALAASSELLTRFGDTSPATTRHIFRRLRDFVSIGASGALSHSFMYKLDGQDSNAGTATFGPDGVAIDWPDYENDPIVTFAEQRLSQWAARAGGTVIPNVASLPGMRTFSVHPLGGCRMGRSIADGVVDTHGHVFDPRGGTYPGLHIADGSIIAGSLGVPPSLTISALAERVAESVLAGPK